MYIRCVAAVWARVLSGLPGNSHSGPPSRMAARGRGRPPRGGSTRKRPAAAASESRAVRPQALPAGDPSGARAPAAGPASPAASAASGRSAGGGEEAAPGNDGNDYNVASWKRPRDLPPGVLAPSFAAVTVVALTPNFAKQMRQTICTTQRAGVSTKARFRVDWTRAVCGPKAFDSPHGYAVFWLPSVAEVSGATPGFLDACIWDRSIKNRIAAVMKSSTELTRSQAKEKAQLEKMPYNMLQFRLIGHTGRSQQAERAPEDWSYASACVSQGRWVSRPNRTGAAAAAPEPSGAAAAAPEGSSVSMKDAQHDSQASAPSQRQFHDPQPHAPRPTADPDRLHGAAWKDAMLVEYTSPPAGFLFTMPEDALRARGQRWPYDRMAPFAHGARGRSAFREALSAWVAAGASDGRARVQRRTAESKPKPSLKRASRGS